MVHCVQVQALGIQSTEKFPIEACKHFFMLGKFTAFNNLQWPSHKNYGANGYKKFFTQTPALFPFPKTIGLSAPAGSVPLAQTVQSVYSLCLNPWMQHLWVWDAS